MISKRYILKRVLQILLAVMFVLFLNFILIRLAPGDPAMYLSGEYADPAVIEYITEKYGLNKPIHEQFFVYVLGVFRGDLGIAYSTAVGTPVIHIIMEKLPNTLLMITSSLAISFLIGNLLGAYSAGKGSVIIDKALSFTLLTTFSMPVFWVGLILIVIFSVNLGWFPSHGVVTIGGNIPYILDKLWHLILPVTALSVGWFIPTFYRLSRATVLEVMAEDYITVARAKGLTQNRVFFKHALRNALLPSTTMLALLLSLSFTGVAVTETVFSWPGMGRLVFEAIYARDYPVIMGVFTITSILVGVFSLILDIVYTYLDPRVTFEGEK